MRKKFFWQPFTRGEEKNSVEVANSIFQFQCGATSGTIDRFQASYWLECRQQAYSRKIRWKWKHSHMFLHNSNLSIEIRDYRFSVRVSFLPSTVYHMLSGLCYLSRANARVFLTLGSLRAEPRPTLKETNFRRIISLSVLAFWQEPPSTKKTGPFQL